jgi:hypothetical protein
MPVDTSANVVRPVGVLSDTGDPSRAQHVAAQEQPATRCTGHSTQYTGVSPTDIRPTSMGALSQRILLTSTTRACYQSRLVAASTELSEHATVRMAIEKHMHICSLYPSRSQPASLSSGTFHRRCIAEPPQLLTSALLQNRLRFLF